MKTDAIDYWRVVLANDEKRKRGRTSVSLHRSLVLLLLPTRSTSALVNYRCRAAAHALSSILRCTRSCFARSTKVDTHASPSVSPRSSSSTRETELVIAVRKDIAPSRLTSIDFALEVILSKIKTNYWTWDKSLVFLLEKKQRRKKIIRQTNIILQAKRQCLQYNGIEKKKRKKWRFFSHIFVMLIHDK